jgi:hypothetical protein
MLSSRPMFPFLRRLLQPAPTVPFDPYRWRRDNRTTGQKVVSGIRLAAGLLAGFVVLALAFGGILTLPAGAPAYASYGPLVSWGVLVLAAAILFLTADRWASSGFGFFCVPAVLKSLTVLIFGTSPYSSYHTLTRTQAAELLLVCIIIISLTWRFAGSHPAPTTFIDRIALTFFVLAAIKQAIISYSWPPLVLISGLLALLIAWCAYRWRQAGRRRTHQHGGQLAPRDALKESPAPDLIGRRILLKVRNAAGKARRFYLLLAGVGIRVLRAGRSSPITAPSHATIAAASFKRFTYTLPTPQSKNDITTIW